jgi:hypothetical protein
VHEGQLAASSMPLATALEAAEGDAKDAGTLGWLYMMLLNAAGLGCVSARDVEQPPLIYTSLLTPLA